ncbi:MAG: aromatic-ring-hydroxylating dioxygenase subunit beta [Rhodospirillales bacterium]|nr:aromatic-ring-hydroxylating dioxygenase subunit beta [Rhodospirillales bacterium]
MRRGPGGLVVDAALQHRVEQFLYREVRLLSELRLEEWLELFTDDARYWMPARETVDGQPDAVAADGEMAFFDDDKAFLAARIERLRSSLAHAEQPPSRMRYFVSNVEIGEASDGELDVRCNLLVYQSRLERTEVLYVGRREDRLRPDGGSWRIAQRKVILDQTLIPRTMSTFF